MPKSTLKPGMMISDHCIECSKPMTDKDKYSTHHCNSCVSKMLEKIVLHMYKSGESADDAAIRKGIEYRKRLKKKKQLAKKKGGKRGR